MMLRLHEKMILTLSAPLVEAPYLTIPQQVFQLPSQFFWPDDSSVLVLINAKI
jgi:hypothetical protein